MSDALTRALIRFARQVVQSVTQQLTQQLSFVEESALNPMRVMVQSVVGGIWIGEGANRFCDEVSGLMIPGVGQVGTQIQTVNNNLNQACTIVDQADTQVNTTVNALGDLFGSIF